MLQDANISNLHLQTKLKNYIVKPKYIRTTQPADTGRNN